ncbi:MAG: ComF family protein [Alphaproteobacteria bacterium]|nr:ComF family protein [Alphaproteobacteria bacterium]
MMRALDTVLPPRCALTGQIVEAQGTLSPEGWQKLEFITAPFCENCGFPFSFEVQEHTLCAACIDYPPSYDSARAALKYGDGSRDLILGFKHGDKTHLLPGFVPWLCRAGAQMLTQADYLIPVPLHYRRLVRRRYNQAALIAQGISKETGVPVLIEALRRTRSTPPQGYMNASDRHKNVRRAFEIHPLYASMIKDKTLILIDDVYTTGATVNECTKVLKKAGAKAVHILTLARVAHDGFG